MLLAGIQKAGATSIDKNGTAYDGGSDQRRRPGQRGRKTAATATARVSTTYASAPA